MELTVKMRHSSLASIDAQQEKTQADSQGTLFIGAGAEANEKIYDMASMFDNYTHTENKFSLCAYIYVYIYLAIFYNLCTMPPSAFVMLLKFFEWLVLCW
jgi:hypothetical protein